MELYFPPPEYHTPEGQKARWKFRFFPGTSLMVLYDVLFKVVLQARKQAVKKELTPEGVAGYAAKTIHLCEETGANVHMTGLNNLTETAGPCVFVCNHMSTLETFALPGIIHPFKPITFVIKDSILRQRMFGVVMEAMDPIPVNRQDPRADLKKVLEEGMIKLKAGISLIIFPQTTRTLVFDPAQFNTLGEKLAKRAGVPVIPVAVKTDFWSPGKIIKDVGKIYPDKDIHMAFGKALDTAGNPKELHQKVIDFVSGKLHSWGAEVREAPGKLQ